MPKLTYKEYALHPAGIFPAQIVQLTEEDGGQFGPAFKVNFLTPQGPVTMLCSQNYGPKSKLGKLVEAALGSRPADLDTDSLEGRRVCLVVEHETKGEVTYDKVTNVLPAGAEKDPFVNA